MLFGAKFGREKMASGKAEKNYNLKNKMLNCFSNNF